jgi:hypothetical protein
MGLLDFQTPTVLEISPVASYKHLLLDSLLQMAL